MAFSLQDSSRSVFAASVLLPLATRVLWQFSAVVVTQLRLAGRLRCDGLRPCVLNVLAMEEAVAMRKMVRGYSQYEMSPWDVVHWQPPSWIPRYHSCPLLPSQYQEARFL